MSRLLSTLLLGTASLLGSASAAFAQAPATQWDRTFSGPSFDYVNALQLTSDGGYILGGVSDSGIGGDKTHANRGMYYDYWVVKVDANGNKQWDQTLGGANSDYLSALVQTTDGGYLLGGSSRSVLSGDRTSPQQGSEDYWIVKLDAAGTKQWDRSFGGNGTNILTTLQSTADGGYILGGYSNADLSGDKTQPSSGLPGTYDYWIVKIDAAGTKQWDRTFGGTGYEELRSLQQTSDGGYILGGSSNSGIGGDKTQAGQGGNDFWVVKVDGSGTKQWDKTFGGDDHERICALQQTSDGGYIAGGTSRSGLSGDKTQASQGITDYWVVKLDASGAKQWDKALGGLNAENLTSLQQTTDGGYLLGGDSNSSMSGDKTQASYGSNGIDCWLVKLDASGTKQWDKTLGGLGYDVTGSVKQTPDGGYVLGATGSPGSSGDKTQPGVGAADCWLVKLGAAPLATKVTTTYAALQAYPNPTSTQFTLSGPAGTPYQLLNQLGQVVRAGQVSTQPLDVQALPAGLYLLRDATSGRTTKLVKE